MLRRFHVYGSRLTGALLTAEHLAERQAEHLAAMNTKKAVGGNIHGARSNFKNHF